MTHPAEKIIESFDALSDVEKREVIAVLLRKTATLEPMTDDELLAAADHVFLDLDTGKSHGGAGLLNEHESELIE